NLDIKRVQSRAARDRGKNGRTIMISDERSSPYGYPPYGGAGAKPGVPEETLKTDKIQIERKTFVFALKENPRGRFLRITEDVNGRRDTIIIPATGLEDFKRIFDEMTRASAETPPKMPNDLEYRLTVFFARI